MDQIQSTLTTTESVNRWMRFRINLTDKLIDLEKGTLFIQQIHDSHKCS
jgi:hypothetical protein